MSLRVWLPLDGDLRNLGCSNASLTNTNAAVNNSGKIGSCYSFGTSNSYLKFNDINFMHSFTECSVSLWLKILSWNTSYATYFQLGLGSTPWAHYIFGLLRNSSASTLCFTISNGSSATNANCLTPALELNTWYHLTLTYANGHCKIYVNGVETKDYSTTIVPNFSGITTGTIGAANNLTGYQTNCLINDFRVYDHCLSAAEVHEIAQGLVLHYKLDDNMHGIKDSSGYNHNGEVLNTLSLVSDTPRYNACTHISATNQKIKISNFPTSGFGNSYSFSWWAKISSASPMHWGFSDGIRLNGMYTGRLWNTGDSSNNPLYKPGTTTQVDTPTVNVWHHWVMTGDGTTCKVYQDGIHWGTAKTYKAISGQTIYINGWDSGTGYSSNNYSISDFRIYCTALTADDVLALYHTGAKVDNKGGIHTYELNEGNGLEENAKFINNSATSVTYDAATDTYTIVSPVGTSSWGYGIRLADTPALEVPYGMTYRWTAEVWTPAALTVQTDYNNAATTAWAGNDNDATGTRLTSSNVIPANTWTRIYRGASNTHASNTNHLPIRDYSSLGLITNGQSGPVTWKVRHLQWYLVDTTFQPKIKKTGAFEAEHFTEVEQNLNKPAQFNKQMFSVNGNEFIEL